MSDIPSIIDKDNVAVTDRTRLLGERGEALACNYLVNKGYRLVVSNFKVPVGRNSKGVQVTGEIDIVALDGDTLVFVEVKTRRSDEFLPVIAAVDLRKQRQITRTARIYRRLFSIYDVPHRFDVVTVLLAKNADPVIEHTKGFWSEAVFRKRAWRDDNWYDAY